MGGSTRTSGLAAQRAARLATPRLAREFETIAAMLRIACRDRHMASRDPQPLCPACAGLLAYARERLAHCPFGAAKPTCDRCPVHCYGRRQREEIRAVMRHSGPRMPLRHPWLALAHLLDGWRAVPPRPSAPRSASLPPAGASSGRATPASVSPDLTPAAPANATRP